MWHDLSVSWFPILSFDVWVCVFLIFFSFSFFFFRNNLTVFDMVMVQGHGAKELLTVGGKLPGPGASLRFNVPQSTLMECRDGESEVYQLSYWCKF